ncbi:MAG: class I tRNA ligase family protein [FCB group bacterium]|nr:class I tRNA ligase family protein [FCB group bacterium]
MMIFINKNSTGQEIPRELIEPFLKLLAPFAPHICEELWARLGHQSCIALAPWPEYDETYLVKKSVNIAIQVNGKLRASIEVGIDSEKDGIISEAKANSNVSRHLEGKQILKEIYVPNRLVNFVVR